jgi:hypothetical protein
MHLVDAIESAQREIPGCVALGLVDLSAGAVLCGAPVERAAFDLAAAACGELLAGGSARGAHQALATVDPTVAEDDAFHEALVMGAERVHVFVRSRTRASCAYVAVCEASVALGLVLAKVRSSLGPVEEAL